MKLHENKILFRQAVQFTADQMKIPAIYVEKDYWVTYALFTIFNNEIGTDTVFKGGTALMIQERLKAIVWEITIETQE